MWLQHRRRTPLSSILELRFSGDSMASAKADSRDSFGSKRSRNDGSRSDGDWTCPQCGNVNFSFRTVCNRSHCGAPRPVLSPRIGSGSFGHPNPYFGSVPEPSMPPGMSSGYRLPLPGMQYNYGYPSNIQGPFRLLPAYGPPGVSYSHGFGMDGYPYRGSPMPLAGSWPPATLPDNNGSRKRRGGPDGLSEGDWVCPNCENVNFSFRTNCNMKKCNAPRPIQGPATGKKDTSGTPEGSWTCNQCGNLNYPFRTVCNRKGCESERPSENSLID